MEVLRSGVRVLKLPADGSGLVAVKLLVEVGWSVERRHEYGICHFLEHLFAKYSSSSRPLAEENELAISNLGIDGNAFTTANETGYWLSGSSEDLGTMTSYLVDCLVSFRVDESVFEKERRAVINELEALRGEKWLRFEEKVHSVVYRGLGDFARRTLARETLAVKSFTPGQVQAFYRRWYTPDRCVLVLSGDVRDWRPPAQLNKPWGGSQAAPRAAPAAPSPPWIRLPARLELSSKRAATTLVQVYFTFQCTKTVRTVLHQKMLLRLLCGSGLTSPMYTRLRGLCYYVHANLERSPERDKHFCCVQTETVEHDKVEEVARLILESVETLFPLEPLLLEREKKRRLRDVREAKLSAAPTSTMSFFSSFLSVGEIPTFDQLEEVVTSTTADDLRVQHELIFRSGPAMIALCAPKKILGYPMPDWGFPPVTFEVSGARRKKKAKVSKKKKKDVNVSQKSDPTSSKRRRSKKGRRSVFDLLNM